MTDVRDELLKRFKNKIKVEELTHNRCDKCDKLVPIDEFSDLSNDAEVFYCKDCRQ